MRRERQREFAEIGGSTMYGKIGAGTVVATGSVATLANTGASVGWLLVAGVSLVAIGLGLRFAVLRRPADR
jgi:LPXTG-motif cell wall-anchored protein